MFNIVFVWIGFHTIVKSSASLFCWIRVGWDILQRIIAIGFIIYSDSWMIHIEMLIGWVVIRLCNFCFGCRQVSLCLFNLASVASFVVILRYDFHFLLRVLGCLWTFFWFYFCVWVTLQFCLLIWVCKFSDCGLTESWWLFGFWGVWRQICMFAGFLFPSFGLCFLWFSLILFV